MAKRTVFIQLHALSISPKKGGYYGILKPNGELDNRKVAQRIKAEGSEYQLETIIELLERGDRIRRKGLLSGEVVRTGWAYGKLGVEGVFDSMTYDKSKHRMTIQLNAPPDMLEEAQEAEVKILNIANTSPKPFLIFDMHTNAENEHITPNNILRVEGNNLRISGDDATVGVWFINESDKTRMKVEQIYTNEPQRLLLKTPDLSAGNYRLEVATQYIRGNKVSNKVKRGVLPHLLIVG